MKRILVCDDEASIRDFVILCLEDDIDAEFVQVEDGESCIKTLSSDPSFDLIICDMYMPGANGLSVHEFNQDNKKIPFILLSGSSADEVADTPNFTKENNCIMVGKPWQPEVLLLTVNVLLGL